MDGYIPEVVELEVIGPHALRITFVMGAQGALISQRRWRKGR